MNNRLLNENEEMLWQNLAQAFLRYAEASRAFLTSEIDRVKLLGEGFRRGDIALTLDLAPSLKSPELAELLPL